MEQVGLSRASMYLKQKHATRKDTNKASVDKMRSIKIFRGANKGTLKRRNREEKDEGKPNK